MASIFARHYPPSFWNPQAPSGPCPYLTLREWEVGVVLCSLSPALQKALVGTLTTPAARQRHKSDDDLSCPLASFAAGELRKPAETLRDLFRKEIKAILQTLDMSLAALHGISRETRLVARGARLRQIAEALGEPLARQEIAALPEPEDQEPPHLAAFFSQRWGGRWAQFFSGAKPGDS